MPFFVYQKSIYWTPVMWHGLYTVQSWAKYNAWFSSPPVSMFNGFQPECLENKSLPMIKK